jgi:hypothetical protein
MIENVPSALYGFSWTAAFADGLTAGLIAMAILVALATLGADRTEPIGAANARASATRSLA